MDLEMVNDYYVLFQKIQLKVAFLLSFPFNVDVAVITTTVTATAINTFQ